MIVSGKDCLGKCYQEGVLYSAHFTECAGDVQYTYLGEYSRTLFTRSEQHYQDLHVASRYQSTQKSSWMLDHLHAHHHDKVQNMDNRLRE